MAVITHYSGHFVTDCYTCYFQIYFATVIATYWGAKKMYMMTVKLHNTHYLKPAMH